MNSLNEIIEELGTAPKNFSGTVTAKDGSWALVVKGEIISYQPYIPLMVFSASTQEVSYHSPLPPKGYYDSNM